MNLVLDPSIASSYKSSSQIARVLTESWASDNLYCVACTSDLIVAHKANTKVIDFHCPRCESQYQLKALSHPFTRTVANGAYQVKIDMINAGKAPNWAFMQYSRASWAIENLVLVPAHFLVPSAVEPRKPLSATARRHGWVGSNILLHRLPQDARIFLVKNSVEMPKTEVREAFSRFSFLKDKNLGAKGWINDVLACVRELKQPEFSLHDVYAFTERLQAQHPQNRHVQPKIRQQLQVLRDNNIIEFKERGKYRVLR